MPKKRKKPNMNISKKVQRLCSCHFDRHYSRHYSHGLLHKKLGFNMVLAILFSIICHNCVFPIAFFVNKNKKVYVPLPKSPKSL